jgi:hypothetical protein
MTFPLLLWAALRFGPAGAATATFAVAAVMAEQASRGLGAFVIAGTRPDQQVVEAYVYLVLAASTALIPAAVLAERMRLTRQLRKNEEQYRQLFERNPHPMWIFDPETLAFLAVNDAAVAQYGYDREEFASRTIRDIRPTEDLARLDRDLASDHHGLDIAGTWRHRKKDGTVFEVEITSHEIDWHGRRAKVVAALDVTERRRLQEQLVHSQKMETVGRLAGGIAHDFNNLLGVILGYSDLALQELGAADPRRPELEQIRSAAELAAGLTRQLLAFSRKQVVDRRVIDLNEILSELEPMLRPAMRENVDFVVLPATGLWPVLADPGEIHQVIMNLAINARDAMPSGGKLALETANVELDAHYAERHFAVTPGDYVMLAVSDTGIGMDAETRAHIFEPFFTLKEKGKGTGLGLASVYGIVEACGGHVWVYSEPGRGTTFKVYLPRAAGAEGASVERSPTEAPGGSETVLVVEDSEGLRELIRTCLERVGYRVHVAASGEEALAAARENPERIHLVVTDVVLPGIGGRQLAAQLSELRPRLRVLFVSGYTDNAIVHNQILDAGVAFLQKPFSPKDLLRRVRAVLDAGEAPRI